LDDFQLAASMAAQHKRSDIMAQAGQVVNKLRKEYTVMSEHKVSENREPQLYGRVEECDSRSTELPFNVASYDQLIDAQLGAIVEQIANYIFNNQKHIEGWKGELLEALREDTRCLGVGGKIPEQRVILEVLVGRNLASGLQVHLAECHINSAGSITEIGFVREYLGISWMESE
jgi:hypothetical protein